MIRILLLTLCLLQVAAAQPIQREVLVLWDSTETPSKDYIQSLTHQKLEVLLNHHGVKAKYLDIGKKIPKSIFSNIKNFKALISWVADESNFQPKNVLRLITEFSKKNKKVLILGHLPFITTDKKKDVSLNYINKAIKPLGFSLSNYYLENPLALSLEMLTPSSNIEYERSLKNEISPYKGLKALKGTSVLLRLRNKFEKTSSDVIFKNKKIFFVASGYEIYQNDFNDVTQWRINPHLLIDWLFEKELYPIPDTTTLFGNRIFYSHIDGDSFISVSLIDRKSLCGEIILNRVINKFKLPVTASIVAAEIDEALLGSKRITKIVKDFYKSPYIELASHTYSHPLSWMQIPDKAELEIYADIKKAKKSKIIVAYDIPNYEKLDYKFEIEDSMDFVNKFATEKNKTNVLFWSGSCRPEEEALKVIYKNGFLNMNGGDSRFDSRYPSLTHLYPLYRKVGPYLQIYSSMSNENTYTNLWQGPFSGFSKAIETFRNTEVPTRIKPINIYYHFYSAEKRSALIALQSLYEWSLTQQIIPIKTSHYIKLAQNFTKVNVFKTKNNSFKITNADEIKTFRYDKVVYPNMLESKNIVGFNHKNGSTYIHLDQSKKDAQIKIDNKPTEQTFIESSQGLISNYKSKDNKISFQFNSLYGKELVIVSNKKIKKTKGFNITKTKPNTYKLKLKKLKQKVYMELINDSN